jgi:uncharacterized protein YodC (DUF2158 family)
MEATEMLKQAGYGLDSELLVPCTADPAPRFKPGDVVKLKSGGPRMTVCKVDGATADCVYFGGLPEPYRPSLPFVTLELAPFPSATTEN